MTLSLHLLTPLRVVVLALVLRKSRFGLAHNQHDACHDRDSVTIKVLVLPIASVLQYNSEATDTLNEECDAAQEDGAPGIHKNLHPSHFAEW